MANELYSRSDPYGLLSDPTDANRKRIILSVLNQFIEKFRSGKRFARVLDIGCGEGWITADLPGIEIVGFDISTIALSRCPRNITTVSRYDEITGSFDLIIATGVLVKNYEYKEILRIIEDHASGIVLTSQTDITEVAEIARFKQREFLTFKFPYRENSQIMRLFDFGTIPNPLYRDFKFKQEGIEASKKAREAQRVLKSKKPVEKTDKKEIDLPTIGYLCMTCDPIDKMNAVMDFMAQDWPNDKKKLYLLKQRDAHGDFPPPLVNNLGLQIVEINCDGYPWPELWTFKVMECLEVCDCQYIVWFDEDDRYPGNYTPIGMKPILDGLGEMSWSWDCIVAEYVVESQRFEFRECWYRSPVGQMFIKTDILRKYIKILWGHLYSGTFKSPKRVRGVPYGGAQDDQLRQMLQKEINPIPHHRAQRVYFIHGQANSAQLRPVGNSIDYRGKRGDESENIYAPGRFNQERS